MQYCFWFTFLIFIGVKAIEGEWKRKQKQKVRVTTKGPEKEEACFSINVSFFFVSNNFIHVS